MGALLTVGILMCVAHVVLGRIVRSILRQRRILRDTPARWVLGAVLGAMLGALQSVVLYTLIPGGSEMSNIDGLLLAVALAVVCFFSAVIALARGFARGA